MTKINWMHINATISQRIAQNLIVIVNAAKLRLDRSTDGDDWKPTEARMTLFAPSKHFPASIATFSPVPLTDVDDCQDHNPEIELKLTAVRCNPYHTPLVARSDKRSQFRHASH